MKELLINVILPLYLLIASGYVAGKLKPELETKTISTAVLYIFAPALIFSSFRRVEISVGDFWNVSIAALLIFMGVFLIAVATELTLFRRRNEAFELSTTVMNAGYLGIPLIYLLLGENALPFALTFMVVMAIYHFTIGILILNSSIKTGIIETLKIPLIYAALLSFLLKGVHIPAGIEKTLKLTGDSTLPLMLFSIGISLSHISPSYLKLSIAGTAVRFFGGLAVALAVTTMLPLNPLLKKVIVVQSSLPSAILNFVLCERFNKSPELAASIIFLSTLTFPLFFIFLSKINV